VPKTYDEKKTASLTNVAGKSGYVPARKLKLDPYLFTLYYILMQKGSWTLISDPKL
jgi:hypothetical protein